MTDWGRPGEDPAAPPPYQGPPSYGSAPQYGAPGYVRAPQGAPVYPTAQYPAPRPPANPYAQMPPYGYGYPPGYGPQPGAGRPGLTVGAAVLGYVAGGLLILAGVLLFFGATFLTHYEDLTGRSHGGYAAEFSVLGFVNLVAAALLIAGSVMMTGRNPTGRLLFSIGTGMVVVLAIYWATRWADRVGGGIVVYAVLFAALVLVGVSLAWTSAVSTWLRPAPHA